MMPLTLANAGEESEKAPCRSRLCRRGSGERCSFARRECDRQGQGEPCCYQRRNGEKDHDLKKILNKKEKDDENTA